MARQASGVQNGACNDPAMNRLQQGRFSTDEWSVALEYIRPLSTWGEPVVVGLTDDRLASFTSGSAATSSHPGPTAR